jgi:hypothetical protein
MQLNKDRRYLLIGPTVLWQTLFVSSNITLKLRRIVMIRIVSKYQVLFDLEFIGHVFSHCFR